MNLAARLQAQCEPDRVLLSHTTYTLVRDEIECIARGEISVKGFHQPVKVYEVLSLRRTERTDSGQPGITPGGGIRMA